MIKSIYFIQNGLAIANKLNNKFPLSEGDTPDRLLFQVTHPEEHVQMVIVLNHPKNKLNCEFYHVSLKLIQS